MTTGTFPTTLAIVTSVVFFVQATQADTSEFVVKPGAGNNTFSAVFDAVIGERINAVSSQVSCTLTVDEEQLEGSAFCSVPLTSIMVDSDATKTEHFQQWATNKKSEPKECTFDVEVANIRLSPPVEAKKPVAFITEGVFTICGRKREDGKPEKISGTVIYLPAGTYGETRKLRVRARIEDFNRELYGVSPAATAGWLARVQQLADVVAADGTVEVNIFASQEDEKTAAKNTH